MPSKYTAFDTSRLKLCPLSQRRHDVTVADILPIDPSAATFTHPLLPAIADAVASARRAGAAVILAMGAHVIKKGLSRYLIDMIDRGWLTHLAGNGAVAIHDYELARVGATSESVARYIKEGRFGLWQETGEINDVVTAGAAEGLGLGEALGRAVATGGKCPHKGLSVLAAAYEHNTPATIHVGIGYDIIHEHPNFNPAATGAASGRDFLVFANAVENLEGGVLLCFGSAVMAPEVYLKALSMARNVAGSRGKEIRHFTSAVFDLVPLEGDPHAEPAPDSHEYYYRPYKTILVRTVADGGQSFYVRGNHTQTLPALHKLLANRRPR
ncbi:MAG: hypothetical protein NTV86_22755 [Planctomycetota bacterium]|nr:hypothetical protein [Planctomycetota bacterium]